MKLNKDLQKYIEENIFPSYSKNDLGHNLDHIKYVINRSLKFANEVKDINYDMVYTIAAYHDIGHFIDAKNHEKISDKLFMDFIKTIPNTPRRFEIKKQGEITLIDDSYNINPYGAKFAIEYLKKQDGVRIIITGGLLELGKLYTTENYDLGVQMKGVDKVILITKKKKHPLLKGYLSTGEKKIQIVKTLKESIPLALQIKGKKTILLLAKGDDFFLK